MEKVETFEVTLTYEEAEVVKKIFRKVTRAIEDEAGLTKEQLAISDTIDDDLCRFFGEDN